MHGQKFVVCKVCTERNHSDLPRLTIQVMFVRVDSEFCDKGMSSEKFREALRLFRESDLKEHDGNVEEATFDYLEMLDLKKEHPSLGPEIDSVDGLILEGDTFAHVLR